MREWLAWVALCTACEAEPRPVPRLLHSARYVSDYVPIALESVRAGCEARAAWNRASRGRVRAAVHVVLAADGVGPYCIGDARTKSYQNCAARGTICRQADEAVDFTFDDADRLARIRVHRLQRGDFGAHRPPRRATRSGIGTGMRLSELPPFSLSTPERRETRDDPEFGTIEVWHYAGLEVEIDTLNDGERVVGALVVRR